MGAYYGHGFSIKLRDPLRQRLCFPHLCFPRAQYMLNNQTMLNKQICQIPSKYSLLNLQCCKYLKKKTGKYL